MQAYYKENFAKATKYKIWTKSTQNASESCIEIKNKVLSDKSQIPLEIVKIKLKKEVKTRSRVT